MISGKELHKLLKTDARTIEQIANDSGISRAQIYKLFDSAKVDDIYIDKLKKAGIKIDKVSIVDGKPVPYYDIDATAGNVTIFNEESVEYIKQHIAVPAFADCDMFINVSGNSMYPKYCSGELIALKRLKDFEVIAFNEAYLIVTDEQRLLKYIRKSKEKNMWTLCSENEAYEPFDIHIKKIRFLYIVKGKITKNII